MQDDLQYRPFTKMKYPFQIFKNGKSCGKVLAEDERDACSVYAKRFSTNANIYKAKKVK